jgi:large subunit ribosomal protein L9
MKTLVLKEAVAFLGDVGDIIKVKDGYARNYLLPQKKALPALPHNIELMQRKKKELDIHRAKEKSKAEAAAEQLRGLVCTIAGKVSEGEKLYGSVAVKDIVDQLAAKNIEVNKKMVLLEEPIKTLGTYTVPIRIHRDVTVEITVEVTTQD